MKEGSGGTVFNRFRNTSYEAAGSFFGTGCVQNDYSQQPSRPLSSLPPERTLTIGEPQWRNGSGLEIAFI